MGYAYEYNYDYPINSALSDSVFAMIMAIYLVVIVAALICWIVEYVFRGIGLYTIAKRQGKNYPWLAFIPFARTYLHGDLAGTIPLRNKAVRSPGVWKLVLPIIYGIVLGVFYVIFFLVLGAGVLSGMFHSYSYGQPSLSIGGGTVAVLVILGLILLVLLIIYEAVYRVLTVLIDFQICGRFTSRNMAIVHAVLSGLLPLYESFCLFALRNRDYNPGMEPKLAPPPVQPIYPGYPVPPAGPEIEHPEPPVRPESEKPDSENKTE